jgi:glutathione peroxidase
VNDLYDIPVRTIDGVDATLERVPRQAAADRECRQPLRIYAAVQGLEALYRNYKDQGLVVLGFPCNQFAQQEPGDERQIRQFCDDQYSVTFPLFAKIDVNGANAQPAVPLLEVGEKGLFGREAIAWNFTKFLIGQNGEVLQRYGPRRKPEDIGKDVARLV